MNYGLYGCYEHSIDKKNRVLMPVKLRENMSETLILFKHIEEKCIAVYSENEWEVIKGKLEGIPQLTGSRAVRRIFSHMMPVQLDPQGRILLPQYLVDYAGLTKDVVVLGAGNHVEIWDAELHRKLEEEEDSPDLIQALKDAGF